MNGKLIVSEGGRERVHELLDDVTVIGRGPQADLRLKDEGAAPAHAEVRRTPQGFKLVDLESREGVRVNGHHVNAHLLRQGDTIRVAGAELTFLGDSAAGAPPPRKPSEKLREMPRNADGEVKRFYRHESAPARRDGADTAIKLIVGVVFAAAVTFAVVEMTRRAHDDTAVIYAEASELAARCDSEQKARRILELLDRLEPGAIDARDASRLRQVARDALAAYKADRLRQEEVAAWNEISRLFAQNSGDSGLIQEKVDDYVLKYPDSPRVAEARKLAKRAQLGVDPERAWDAFVADVAAAVRGKRFGEAFEKFAKFEANAALVKELGSRVETNRRVLEETYGRFVAERFQTAQEAASRNDPVVARGIYEQIAAIGVAPYADAARKALERLK